MNNHTCTLYDLHIAVLVELKTLDPTVPIHCALSQWHKTRCIICTNVPKYWHFNLRVIWQLNLQILLQLLGFVIMATRSSGWFKSVRFLKAHPITAHPYSRREPAVSVPLAKGRFHETWKDQLAEIWLQNNPIVIWHKESNTTEWMLRDVKTTWR